MNMKACERESKRLSLLQDDKASFVRVRAIGAHRMSRHVESLVRRFNYGMVEVCKMSRPTLARSRFGGHKRALYPDRRNHGVPRKTWQVHIPNQFALTPDMEEEHIFTLQRLNLHVTNWR